MSPPLFGDGVITMHRFDYPTNSRDEMIIKVDQDAVAKSSSQRLFGLMKSIRRAAVWVSTSRYHRRHSPDRVAFMYAGLDDIRLIPLHIESPFGKKDNVDTEPYVKKWAAIRSKEPPTFYDTFPGFITSVDGPLASADSLDKVQELFLRDRMTPTSTIASEVPQACWSYRFDGDPTDDNLFARLVRGEIQQRRIWESETHVAFLTPYPNSVGCSVLIPRKHLSSDVFALNDDDYESLIRATQIVVDLIQQTFNKYNDEISDGGCECYDVGIIFEGYEIDYTHVKMYPMIRKKKATEVAEEITRGVEIRETSTSTEIKPSITGAFTETYRGHITSKYGPYRQFDNSIGD